MTANISKKVSSLRLEAYLGQVVLKVGLASYVLTSVARIQLSKHLGGSRISAFLVGLPATLACQNYNYLLANYEENTIARIKLSNFPTEESDQKRVTDIQFAAPETEEDFNK